MDMYTALSFELCVACRIELCRTHLVLIALKNCKNVHKQVPSEQMEKAFFYAASLFSDAAHKCPCTCIVHTVHIWPVQWSVGFMFSDATGFLSCSLDDGANIAHKRPANLFIVTK